MSVENTIKSKNQVIDFNIDKNSKVCQKNLFDFVIPWTPKASDYCYCTMSTQNESLKMIRAVCGSFSARKLTRHIFYRNCWNFNVQQFFIDLETNLILGNEC